MHRRRVRPRRAAPALAIACAATVPAAATDASAAPRAYSRRQLVASKWVPAPWPPARRRRRSPRRPPPPPRRYRSRAAFKLIQLNRKYDFLSGARTLLDLCAAPGGWLQVAVKTMPVGALVLGVDLVPIKPVRGARSLLGDITTAATRAAVRRESSGALMDVVLHDGAPNVGGAWSSEAYSQSALVLDAARIAADLLAPGGWFITKVFRSKDYTALLYALRQLFNKVEATKPAASRGASAEIFVVCSGYRAPAKIDPRLLDARHLFQEVAEPPKPAGPDALLKAKVKQKRWREGYADGATILRTVEPAAGFVVSDAPVEALGRASALALEGGGAEGELLEGSGEGRRRRAGQGDAFIKLNRLERGAHARPPNVETSSTLTAPPAASIRVLSNSITTRLSLTRFRPLSPPRSRGRGRR